MKKPTQKEILEFLEHNNRIEGVFDVDSLQQAREAWKYLMKQKVMTPGVVLKTHKILMLHQNLMPDEKGYFRRCPVYIGGHEALNYRQIPEAVEEWCDDANFLISNSPHPQAEAIVKKNHLTYEAIHPFVDGNGRTGRMFMNWERLQAGLPLLIIHEGKEQMEYYRWFREDLSNLDTNEI